LNYKASSQQSAAANLYSVEQSIDDTKNTASKARLIQKSMQSARALLHLHHKQSLSIAQSSQRTGKAR